MFRWYEQAQVCYAYLSDVTSATEYPRKEKAEFWRSKWFTRGWTLQELLAPYFVDFFDRNWNWIGSKGSLGDLIRSKTRITDFSSYKTASVAQKMSWASSRKTTRIEDQAYCLLGLFGVHIPPLYGEGENAFIRLQLEIISKTSDDSILAFDRQGRNNRGMLAGSPRDFMDSSSIVRALWDPSRPPHSMSSKGLCVHFKLIPKGGGTFSDVFLAPLNCAFTSPDGEIDRKKVIALSMDRFGGVDNPSWSRAARFSVLDIDSEGIAEKERTVLYVPQTSGREEGSTSVLLGFINIRVVIESLSEIGLGPKKYMTKTPGALWKGRDDVRQLTLNYNIDKTFSEVKSWAAVTLETNDLQRVGLILGMSKGRPWIDIVVLHADESMEQILDSVPTARKLLIGHDRVSRPFLQGSLNGRLNMGHSLFEPRVEVTFDSEGKLRWPVRNTS
jgi:hypothetical protein